MHSHHKHFLTYRVILALGISMTFINIPVEWFSIGFNWTWMLLFGDIRQGIFYSMLLSFWIIFCGEHLMVLYLAPLDLFLNKNIVYTVAMLVYCS